MEDSRGWSRVVRYRLGLLSQRGGKGPRLKHAIFWGPNSKVLVRWCKYSRRGNSEDQEYSSSLAMDWRLRCRYKEEGTRRGNVKRVAEQFGRVCISRYVQGCIHGGYATVVGINGSSICRYRIALFEVVQIFWYFRDLCLAIGVPMGNLCNPFNLIWMNYMGCTWVSCFFLIWFPLGGLFQEFCCFYFQGSALVSLYSRF